MAEDPTIVRQFNPGQRPDTRQAPEALSLERAIARLLVDFESAYQVEIQQRDFGRAIQFALLTGPGRITYSGDQPDLLLRLARAAEYAQLDTTMIETSPGAIADKLPPGANTRLAREDLRHNLNIRRAALLYAFGLHAHPSRSSVDMLLDILPHHFVKALALTVQGEEVWAAIGRAMSPASYNVPD